jgi:hypothetical protein
MKFQEIVMQLPDSRILLIGGALDSGTEFVISLEKPLKLVDYLRDKPVVEQIVKHGKKMGIILRKTPSLETGVH